MEKLVARTHHVAVVEKRRQRIPVVAVVILTQRKVVVAAVRILRQRVAVRKQQLLMRTVEVAAVAVSAANLGKECYI